MLTDVLIIPPHHLRGNTHEGLTVDDSWEAVLEFHVDQLASGIILLKYWHLSSSRNRGSCKLKEILLNLLSSFDLS